MVCITHFWEVRVKQNSHRLIVGVSLAFWSDLKFCGEDPQKGFIPESSAAPNGSVDNNETRRRPPKGDEAMVHVRADPINIGGVFV